MSFYFKQIKISCFDDYRVTGEPDIMADSRGPLTSLMSLYIDCGVAKSELFTLKTAHHMLGQRQEREGKGEKEKL